MLDFPKRLRELRKEKKLKQREMAEICGIKLRSYQQYEYCETLPEIDRLIYLADYFGVSLDYLVGREFEAEDIQSEAEAADSLGRELPADIPENCTSVFSQRLKQLRKEKKLKQKDMADHLNMSLRGYQCYEYGRCYPEVAGLLSMADLFGVSVDYLLGRTDQREVNR